MKNNKFTPMKVYTDERAYNNAQAKAEQKLKVLWEAFEWCSQHINEDDINRQKFLEDMSKEFERLFVIKNKSIVNKALSYDKLLFLLDVNTDALVELENRYNSYESKVFVSEDSTDFLTKVDAKDYTIYTKNKDENDRLIVANNLINAIGMVERYSKVYPLTIQQATSSFLKFDIVANKYRMSN